MAGRGGSMTLCSPTIYIVSRKDSEKGSTVGRWFRLDDYRDADAFYDDIKRWLVELGHETLVDESAVRFVEYRNMPSFGPVPRRIWLADYVAALRAGADPDALM